MPTCCSKVLCLDHVPIIDWQNDTGADIHVEKVDTFLVVEAWKVKHIDKLMGCIDISAS